MRRTCGRGRQMCVREGGCDGACVNGRWMCMREGMQ